MKEFRCAAKALCCLPVLWTAAACTDSTLPPEPPSFEQPNRVTLVCVDEGQEITAPNALVGLERCTTKSPVDAGVNDTEATNFVLHALITQSSRGEVAAVDLPARHVIDSRSDIPGPTFVPTGELPVAIAVSPRFPRRTYVANAGSHDISVLRTSSFLHGSLGERTTLAHVALQRGPGAPAVTPFDMILAPNQDALFVSSAQSGLLLRIPILRCADPNQSCEEDGALDESNIQEIPLADSWSQVPAEAFQNNGGGDPVLEPYRFVCPTADDAPANAARYDQLRATPSTAVELPDPAADVGTPQPAGMTLDAFCDKEANPDGCTRRLLIADKQQPIIHVVDVDSLAVLPPILSGAPTERVAISPPVPVTRDESPELTQYVYALDARDGSVLVAQNGRVQNVSVNPAQRSDRLDLGLPQANGTAVALSLAVITPDFDTTNAAPQWLIKPDPSPTQANPLSCLDPDHTTRNAARLRGVFLAVGLTDGTVRVLNIHDMELLNCRSCERAEPADYNMAHTGFDPYPVVRHRPRIGVTLAPTGVIEDPLLSPLVTPQFVLEGSTVGVKSDGTTNDTRVLGLGCVPCSEGEAPSFPTPGEALNLANAADGGAASTTTSDQAMGPSLCPEKQARVCSIADPFIEPLAWQAVYEGVIPGSRGGSGRFVPAGDADNTTGDLEFVGGPDFCHAGVLGSDELPAGDQVEIISELPNERLRENAAGPLNDSDNDFCNSLISLRSEGEDPIAFRIRRAYADRLVIESQLYHRTGSRQPEGDWSRVQRCFANTLLTFQVHSSASFVVQSSGGLGFQHSVERDGDGRCVQRASDLLHRGRVRPGEIFDNGLIAFSPRENSYLVGTSLNLYSTSGSPKLRMDASDLGASGIIRGVMPVDMHYSPMDETLYTVDITSRGLIPLTFDPMPYRMDYGTTIQ